jgi:hypothetical protein
MKLWGVSFLAGLACLAMACGPGGANVKLKNQVDSELARTPGPRNVDEVSSGHPVPLAVGQWIKYRMTDKKGEPSVYTYKIVGREGRALWLEYSMVSYYNSIEYRMLMEMNPASPHDSNIRKVIARFDGEEIIEYDDSVIQLTQSMYNNIIESFFMEWDTSMKRDISVAAGTFSGCDRIVSSFRLGNQNLNAAFVHSEVPISGIVKFEGDSMKMELLSYGLTGAVSSFNF